MNNRDFDQIIDAIAKDVPDERTVNEAAARVKARLEQEMGESATLARLDGERLESCADFQALLPAYRANHLSEARRMLVKDHLQSCVACRRVLHGERADRPTVVSISSKPRVARRVVPYAIAAAIIGAMAVTLPPVLDRLMAPGGARATVASVNGELYRVSDQGLMPLATGAALNEHDEIRTAKNSHAVVRLRDGSSIEMGERAALTLSERWSGKTIYLDRGQVMVEAAKQRHGKLEVITPDCDVTVHGTIFEVSRGTKGSRVSVVEGEVKVDREGDSKLLHRGDQTTTSQTMTATSVAEDVAWSQNSAKYVALLGEFSLIQKRINAIPGPGLRYQSKLTVLLPENTALFASIPNLAPVLAQADAIFQSRVAESPVLREWWNEKETQQLRAIVNQVKTFGDYLGDEVVLAVPSVNGEIQAPVVIAEARKGGLPQYLQQQFALLKATTGGAPVLLSDLTSPVTDRDGPLVMVRGNIVAVAGKKADLAAIASKVDASAQTGFNATPFGQSIAQSYQNGVSWIFSANMEQIVHGFVPNSQKVTPATTTAGIDNVRYLTVERKDSGAQTVNTASLTFSGARHGLMSWLAAPGPMGTLDFVSPEATFAASFVVKNPGEVLSELINMAGGDAGAASVLNQIQQQTGVNLLNDVAANLGGEMTLAFDGPLLPTPSWKVAIEVDNPARLEWAIEQAVSASQKDYPDAAVTLSNSTAGGLAYHTLKSPKLPVEIDYVFTDGYWLIAPSQALLETAIQNRASGLTLQRSAAFRAQLPQDGHVNFSGLVYYNLGSTVGPIIDQLKKGGLMTPEQEKSAGLITSNREPGLIYAYGEPDRIVVGAGGSSFGLGLDTLLGLNAKGMAALPQLMPLGLIGQKH